MRYSSFAIWLGISLMVLYPIALALSWPWAGLALFLGVPIAIAGAKIRQKRSEAQKMVWHADWQHNAIMRGDIRTGTYGMYLPAPQAPVVVSDWAWKGNPS